MTNDVGWFAVPNGIYMRYIHVYAVSLDGDIVYGVVLAAIIIPPIRALT